MALVAVTASKGAPGVTTVATALAALWPRPALLADCDPAGGDVWLRLRDNHGQPLASERSVVSLAARLRTSATEAAVLDAELQASAGGLQVLLGVPGPAQAAAIGSGWAGIARALARDSDRDTIADCGRHTPGSVATPVVRSADVVLAVCPGTLEGVAHLRQVLPDLSSPGHDGRRRHVLVAVIDDPARPSDAADAVRQALPTSDCPVPIVVTLPWDVTAAAGMSGQPVRRLDKTRLVGAIRVLAQQLAAELEPAVISTRPAMQPAAVPDEPGWQQWPAVDAATVDLADR